MSRTEQKAPPEIPFTCQCDDKNNGWGEEQEGIVNLDLRFQGSKKVYRLELASINKDEPYDVFLSRIKTLAEPLLRTFPSREIADTIQGWLHRKNPGYK